MVRNVPGTRHYYVDLPDELKPAAELERQGNLDQPGLTDTDYAAYAATMENHSQEEKR